MNLHDGDPFWPRRDGLLSVHPPLLVDASVECGCWDPWVEGGDRYAEVVRKFTFHFGK